MTRTLHASPSLAHAAPTGRLVRFFAIAIVFAMGAAFALPTPAAAQVTATVSGFVVDGDGNGLGDAEVVLKKQNGSLWSYHETHTDESGAFAIAGVVPGSGWTLSARLDGHRTNTTTITLDAGQEDPRNITLYSLTERSYVGHLIDSNGENPIAGALVTVTGYDAEKGESVRTTTSDDEGDFRVALFANENQIRIEKGGYATYYDWVYQPNGIIERTIWMQQVPPQTATISGKVLDAAGNPVQAYVSIYPVYEPCCASGGTEPAEDGVAKPGMVAPDSYHYNNYNSTVTAADGTFTMKAYPGTITIQANRQGYLVGQQQLTLQEDKTSSVTLELGKLPERTVTVSGTVTDQKTGKPIPGASISVQVPAAGDYSWASADDKGRFSVTVRPGYTLVEVNHWGYCCIAYDTMTASSDGASMAEDRAIAPYPYPGDATKYHPVSLTFTTKANEKKTLDAALEPKPEPETTVVGYVIDAANGKAVAGAQVSLQNHATGEWGQAITDTNGSYKFQAYGGYHTIRVYRDGYLPYATNADIPATGAERLDLEVTAGQQVQEGWWSPDGYGGGDGVEPRPLPASAPSDGGMDAAESKAGMARDSDDGLAGSGEESRGAQTYTGSGGGLPAYDPAKKDDTFGAGESAESPPASPVMLVVLALGALAVVAGLRRKE